jgi:hypothetical protein
MATPIIKRAMSLFGREGQGPAVTAPRKPPSRFHAVTVVAGPRRAPLRGLYVTRGSCRARRRHCR